MGSRRVPRNPDGRISSERGQSTVEYAVVAAALLAIVVGCGVVAQFLGDGVLAKHAAAAASHNTGSGPGGVVDVFCY